MKKTNMKLEDLKEYIKNRKFQIQSLDDIMNPFKDLDRKGINYRKIEKPIEHPEDGYVDGYLLVETEEGKIFIPFYYQGEVHGVHLRLPRLLNKEDTVYLRNVLKEIEQTVKNLKMTYDDIKDILN